MNLLQADSSILPSDEAQLSQPIFNLENSSQHKNQELSVKAEQQLLLYLTPGYLKKAIVSSEESENKALFVSAEQFSSFHKSYAPFAKKTFTNFSRLEQISIIEQICEWTLLHKNLNDGIKPCLIISPEMKAFSSLPELLEMLSVRCDVQVMQLGFVELARLSALGAKTNLSNYRANARILTLSINKRRITACIGDMQKGEEVFHLDFGAEHAHQQIQALQKTDQLQYLLTCLKANLLGLVEQIKSLGKVQIATFDDLTARLLTSALSRDSEVHRIHTDWISQLISRIVDNNLQVPGLEAELAIDSDTMEYYASHLILVSLLLDGCGVPVNSIAQDCLFKGHCVQSLLTKALSDNQTLSTSSTLAQREPFSVYSLSDHLLDWKRSAQQLLLQLSPGLLPSSLQVAFLSMRLFDSSRELLHHWSLQEKLLYLATFFSASLSSYSVELIEELLSELQGVTFEECRLIASAIKAYSAAEIGDKFKILADLLERIEASQRKFVSQLAAFVSLARAMNVSVRSAIASFSIEVMNAEVNSLLLKMSPRLDPTPELVQMQIKKKDFEQCFEHKLYLSLQSADNARSV